MTTPALPVRLAISGKHYRELKTHLFPGDGNEAVAFALCGRARRKELELLVVREIAPIPYVACRIRTPYTVAWQGVALEPILKRAVSMDLAIVKIHSHPNGYEWFSDTDDIAEDEMFPSVFGWLDTDAPLASLIMLPDGSLVGRAVHENGRGAPLDGIRLADDDFHFWQYAENDAKGIPDHAERIVQAFGEGTYRLQRKLRIGVVGSSGTGSIIIEQLARNCIGELINADSDHIEEKNLNRILNSSADDVRNQTPKPEVQKRAIVAMGLGTKVFSFDKDLMNLDVLMALSTCDILFGCMDSVDGRHVLNKLASAYVIPLIDIGVRLEADGQGGIESIWSAVHTILPGCSSLFSRRVYSQDDLDAAFLKRTNPEEYESQLKDGYIRGVRVDRPAVISVNMDAAAAAMNEFLARIHPYRVMPNRNFAIRRICLTDPEASSNEGEPRPCPIMDRMVGTGDQKPFLGMPLLGSSN